MEFKYTLVSHKIFHGTVEANSEEEAKIQIAQKFYPMKSQGYIILDNEIEFNNYIEYDT